ncbi:MAG: hypothetical protein K2K53_12560 [Oscillospiraceae bacterium]|nr:hypothetical protein [Oscillospiraceae bacterium]
MKRISEIAMAVCFLGLLAAGLITTVTREPELISFWENRMLAAFPEYSPQSVGDGSYVTQVEAYLSDHAAARTTLLKTKTRMDLALRRPVVNEVVVTENSLLPYLPYDTTPLEMLDVWAGAMADNLERISGTVSEYGGYFCYVAVPCQSVSRSGEYPWYLNSQEQFNQRKGDALAQAMDERGVAFLDVQTALGDTAAYSSRIDNHYSMEGAFLTYRLILEKAAADTGLKFPILDRDDFEWVTLPQDYMGSRERKLLDLEQRDEQLTILLPKQEVPYTRADNGTPNEAFVYDLPAAGAGQVSYTMYMGGDIANTVIDTGREELPTILIYGDSFTNPVECLAYLSFDETHSLDLRHYHEMGLEDYIRQLQPDVVVCIRDYDFLLVPEGNGGN